MNDIEYVRGLKSNFHQVFDSPQGKEVLKYLEITCGWYRPVYAKDNDLTLVNDGKRQVIATIKSILDLSPEQIVYLAGKEEQ